MTGRSVPAAVAYADFAPPPGRVAFPDVCCDLLVIDGRCYLSGPELRSQPNEFPTGRRELLRIDPFAMRDWLRMPLVEVANRTILLADIDRDLAARMETLIEQKNLRATLASANPPASTGLDRLELAARLVGGGWAVEAAAGAINISSRQLERMFNRELGMSPRLWRSIIRFRAAALAARRGASLAQAASLGGYADQAHFSRASRALTGKTPRAFIAQHVGIVQDAEIGRF